MLRFLESFQRKTGSLGLFSPSVLWDSRSVCSLSLPITASFFGFPKPPGSQLHLAFAVRGPKIIVNPRNIIQFWKIQPGDLVQVMVGNKQDKGRRGKVIMIDKLRNMVKVKGCRLRILRLKDKATKIVQKKIHVSNVMLIDPVLDVPTRVRVLDKYGDMPLRVACKSGAVLPWPPGVHFHGSRPRRACLKNYFDGPKDTTPEKAMEVTYDYDQDVDAVMTTRMTMTKYNQDLDT